MERNGSLPRLVALCALVLAVAAACNRAPQTTPQIPDPPAGGSVPESAEPQPAVTITVTDSASQSPSDDAGGGGGNGGTSESSTADDMKVFAHASTDEVALAAEVADIADTIVALEGDAQAHDVEAAQQDAGRLLDQADRLGKDADEATARQKPLAPSDGTLKKARADAIDAFRLTADYASTVSDLADAAMDLNIAELASVAAQASSLAGTSNDITQAYTDLTTELEQWAIDHPASAATALTKYA